MESSADKYLHKKFKKQLSIEPHKIQNNDKEAKTVLPHASITDASQDVRSNAVSNNNRTNNQQTEQCYKVEQTRTDNNQSVPNQSTNQNSLSVLNPQYACSYVKSSISQLNDEVTTNLTSTNTCISYVISQPSRIVSLNQPESSLKSVNFDTNFNQNEPTSTNPSSVVESSSILDNTYSKPTYVTSKLVKIDKEDISSINQDRKDHFSEEQSSCAEKQAERKQEIQENSAVPDKNSGGKYVCTYCNLACSKPSVLQKHIRAHTNERPYPCVSCGFSFKTRSNLYKHCRSRTHANRVMGNKAQEINNEMEIDSEHRPEYNEFAEQRQENEVREQKEMNVQDVKSKPYKPRFHTAKAFFDSFTKENRDASEKSIESLPSAPKHSNSDLLSLHINDIINKNNTIVNSSDPYLMKRRSTDGNPLESNSGNTERYKDSAYLNANAVNAEEPLNLTNKNRKRCMSDVGEPSTQKSLIKELLLKNLYADSNMQCRYCKMIFQTVTEFELHKLRSCRGANKSGVRYSRSSSVNVASILTQNKNAFDGIPHMQNTVFLKSPGPFLGKTRLVESDKNKSFSFDDVLPTTFQSVHSPSDAAKTPRYSLSPLTLQYDRDKKTPVKLFGGEVKITHTSGETKSFKIDSKENDKFDGNYVEYGGKLSENRVVKSSLQSGGTVLTNQPNYSKHDSLAQTQDIIRVYDGTSASPGAKANLEKSKFNFDKHEILESQCNSEAPRISTISSASLAGFNNGSSYKYTNIVDFSQKAAKLLAPNIKQLNLTIPGLPVPNKCLPHSPLTIENKQEQSSMHLAESSVSIDFPQNQVSSQQKAYEPTFQTAPPLQQNLYNPMNLIVNGKVIRYVPGMPGPISAEAPLEMTYSSNIISTGRLPSTPLCIPSSHSSIPKPVIVVENNPHPSTPLTSSSQDNKIHVQPESGASKIEELEIKTITSPKTIELKSPITKTSDSKSPIENKSPANETRKFARPNSLALKPSMAAIKQHHGLTPTMFNQILISPDTPRVAKKYMQHFLHGNYFSYLGLKSSTKPVYCTLNKTQPFYVLMKHFKKLSMYSEWRQQDNKTDRLYGSAYDSRQKQQKYTMAGKTAADLIVHSSYKFTVTESVGKSEEQKSNSVLGGYESNEDYTYIRGRGRGRYVCDQCGIRCKKPSMLKKHIRTHSNDRPYTCSHCNFSFKTKGNLTKHMKSKSHTKNYAASGSSSASSYQQSGTQSSESETEDSGMDSSDESTTRQQEHEAAYGLLSLSQKTTADIASNLHTDHRENPASPEMSVNFMNTEQIAHVTKTNFAKNKILDQQNINFTSPKDFTNLQTAEETSSKEIQNLINFLGKSNTSRPLTYPYTAIVANESKIKNADYINGASKLNNPVKISPENINEPKNIRHFNVIKRYNNPELLPSPNLSEPRIVSCTVYEHSTEKVKSSKEVLVIQQPPKFAQYIVSPPIVKVNDRVVFNENNENTVTDLRKRKTSLENNLKIKVQKNDEVIDLSMSTNVEKHFSSEKFNGLNDDNLQRINYNNNHLQTKPDTIYYKKNYNEAVNPYKKAPEQVPVYKNLASVFVHEENYVNQHVYKSHEVLNQKSLRSEDNAMNVNYVSQEPPPVVIEKSFKQTEYDNSAMETLADIATKQVKLEKNTLAKSVASEYLKLATKNELVAVEGAVDNNSFVSSSKEVNELILKPEENKSCTICAKNFNKPSQLRLHMNVHYLERPFRCDSCSVSFRSKGHLQKHERSASHHNKLSSSPALSSSEPRPFKCSDCNIAFRIHGHLAKHLRSKMHIMKLECLAKIPFGLYAELERSNSLLTEINTADGDQCLESLKTLAKKVFINDPSKLNQIEKNS